MPKSAYTQTNETHWFCSFIQNFCSHSNKIGKNVYCITLYNIQLAFIAPSSNWDE